MSDLLKACTFFLLFNAYALSAFSQAVDSTKVAQTKDTLKVVSVSAEKFTPDTVFIINGDKITGNILSYEDGRLKVDAQSAGVINIKHQKIFSISGGSRLFFIKDKSNVSYTGYIRLSQDTGKIFLADSLTYELLFKDIAAFRPVKSIKDTAKVEIVEEKQPVADHVPDTLFLKNGERYTGNILSLEQGSIKMDAQGAGMVNVGWHKIITVKGGSRLFRVEDQRGEIYIGNIQASKDTGEIEIAGKNKHAIMLEDIVRMFPLEEEWYRRFKGTVGGGLNYTKSSDVLNINFDCNLYYIIKKWRFANSISFIETSTSEDDPSVRISVDLQAFYSLPGKWVLTEINSFNRNDELGIVSRISFGAGGGYNLVVTERQRLLALSGMIHNSEKNIESTDVISNFELPVTLHHNVYSFFSPDLTSTTSISYFKGITESGRYRIDASTDVTWEFIKWVKLKLSFYYNFDNKEVEGKESQEDYGTVISLLVDLK